MATIRLYLDTRTRRRDGTYSIRLAINHHSGTAFISLNQYAKPAEWDKVTGKVKKRPDKEAINEYLLNRLAFYNKMLMKVLCRDDYRGDITATQLRDLILEEANPMAKKSVTLYEMFKRYMAREMRANTYNNYKYTWTSIERFADDARNLEIDSITREWLDRYDRHLIEEEGLKKNSRVQRLRCICAVFNYARDNELTTNYPFRRLDLSMTDTKKRNLSSEELREIFAAIVTDKKRPFRDLFKLIFLLIGINVHDLYNLTPENIIDGRLEYDRLKTKKHYSIKLEPEALEMIRANMGKKKLLAICDHYVTFNSFFVGFSNALHDMREELTTYYARHSWATIAYKLGISKDTISQALGHSFGVRVTSTYINPDYTKVDEANRKVIDWVLYGKK